MLMAASESPRLRLQRCSLTSRACAHVLDRRGFHSNKAWQIRLRRMAGFVDQLALAPPGVRARTRARILCNGTNRAHALKSELAHDPGFEFPSLGPAAVSQVVSTRPSLPPRPPPRPDVSGCMAAHTYNLALTVHLQLRVVSNSRARARLCAERLSTAVLEGLGTLAPHHC